MPTSLAGLALLLVAVLFVLRFRRSDLDEDSRAALQREELRVRGQIVQALIVGALGTIGITTYGAVKITTAALQLAATQESPVSRPATASGSPHSPAKLAELREARAGLVRSIAHLEARIAEMLAQPTRPDDSEYERGVSTEGAVARGVEELSGNLDYERARLADIEAELAWTGDTP